MLAEWVILANDWSKRNRRPTFYKPDGRGYTFCIYAAGRYGEAEAMTLADASTGRVAAIRIGSPDWLSLEAAMYREAMLPELIQHTEAIRRAIEAASHAP